MDEHTTEMARLIGGLEHILFAMKATPSEKLKRAQILMKESYEKLDWKIEETNE